MSFVLSVLALTLALGGSEGAAEPALSTDSKVPSIAEICISRFEHSADARRTALGIAPPEAVRLTHEIVTRIGTSNQPTVVSCVQIEKAQADVEEDFQFSNGVSGPAGEYILYNPRWTSEVIGSDEDQATVIFGHEVGHLINGDFSVARQKVPVVDREKQADRFAGCAAATRGVSWETVESILSRLRDEDARDYPSRSVSLSEAQAGYHSCLVLTPPMRTSSEQPTQGASPVAYQAPIPRSLDPNKKRLLIAALSGMSPSVKQATIYYTPNDNESFSYASDFQTVFERAGLKPVLSPQSMENPSETGIMIIHYDNSDVTFGEKLRSALTAVGLISHLIKRSGQAALGASELDIFIGPQPF